MSGIYFRPVVPILVSLMIGIVAGCRFPDHQIWPWVLSIIGLGMLFFLVGRKKQGRMVPLFFFFALGYLSIQPWMSAHFPPNHIVHFRDASAWEIEGTIAGKPIVENSRVRFILDTKSVTNTGQRVPVIGRIAVSSYGKNPELSIGDVVELMGEELVVTPYED